MKYIITESQLKIIIENDSPENDNTLKIIGKVVDPTNMTPEEKEEFKLKEKVVLDKSELEYPIVLIQLRNGKYIIFDVNHGLDLDS